MTHSARHGACAVKNRRREEFSFSLSFENVSARVVTRAWRRIEGYNPVPSLEITRGIAADLTHLRGKYVGTSILPR